MPRKNISANPYLSEYVYDLLWNVTAENKLKLSRKYWCLMVSSIRARNFADFSTLEQKMELFSELGISYAFIISPEKFDNKGGLKKIMQLYNQDKTAGAVKKASELKTFVVTERDTAFFLSLLSQTIHHSGYFLNQQLNKTIYHIKNWKKNEISPEAVKFRESIDAADTIDRMLYNCAVNIDFVPAILGIKPLDLKILLYMNQFRHRYVPKEEVQADFSSYNKKHVATSLNKLLLNNYLMKHQKSVEQIYTISTAGIRAVGTFREIILKQNNFE